MGDDTGKGGMTTVSLNPQPVNKNRLKQDKLRLF